MPRYLLTVRVSRSRDPLPRRQYRPFRPSTLVLTLILVSLLLPSSILTLLTLRASRLSSTYHTTTEVPPKLEVRYSLYPLSARLTSPLHAYVPLQVSLPSILHPIGGPIPTTSRMLPQTGDGGQSRMGEKPAAEEGKGKSKGLPDDVAVAARRLLAALGRVYASSSSSSSYPAAVSTRMNGVAPREREMEGWNRLEQEILEVWRSAERLRGEYMSLDSEMVSLLSSELESMSAAAGVIQAGFRRRTVIPLWGPMISTSQPTRLLERFVGVLGRWWGRRRSGNAITRNEGPVMPKEEEDQLEGGDEWIWLGEGIERPARLMTRRAWAVWAAKAALGVYFSRERAPVDTLLELLDVLEAVLEKLETDLARVVAMVDGWEAGASLGRMPIQSRSWWGRERPEVEVERPGLKEVRAALHTLSAEKWHVSLAIQRAREAQTLAVKAKSEWEGVRGELGALVGSRGTRTVRGDEAQQREQEEWVEVTIMDDLDEVWKAIIYAKVEFDRGEAEWRAWRSSAEDEAAFGN